MRYDLWLRGGTVVDGTGRPPFAADVLVKDGRIADSLGLDPLHGALEILKVCGPEVFITTL